MGRLPETRRGGNPARSGATGDEENQPKTRESKRKRARTVWRWAGSALWAIGLFVVCVGCLIAIWAFGWTVINDVFQLDEVQWWNREITYDEIWQWLTRD